MRGPSSPISARSSRSATRSPRLDFPVNLLVKFAPRPLTGPVTAPEPKDRLAYGKYIVTIAGCRICHTPNDEGQADPRHGVLRAAWNSGPWGRVISANITPDPENYMGQATREEFIARFKSFEGIRREHPGRAARAQHGDALARSPG